MELREWLFRKRKTVTGFAGELGISRTHLNGIINAGSRPGTQLAKKIEEKTEGLVSVRELLYPEEFSNES